MDFSELAKVYMSCNKKINQMLSPKFKEMIENYLIENLPKSQAHSLPYVIPLLANSEKLLPDEVRTVVMKLLKQKDFSASTYILVIGQLLELFKGELLKQDLEFWR